MLPPIGGSTMFNYDSDLRSNLDRMGAWNVWKADFTLYAVAFVDRQLQELFVFLIIAAKITPLNAA